MRPSPGTHISQSPPGVAWGSRPLSAAQTVPAFPRGPAAGSQLREVTAGKGLHPLCSNWDGQVSPLRNPARHVPEMHTPGHPPPAGPEGQAYFTAHLWLQNTPAFNVRALQGTSVSVHTHTRVFMCVCMCAGVHVHSYPERKHVEAMPVYDVYVQWLQKECL